ncbi:AraC family transcriptional regulator [Flavobacterium sp. MK4S-17]|uniref:helix-turn-helix domain-containing protein n=1 Tax=Flavobacterium sp. MK4S-17 TaxID=2543737 RepID=UPI001357E0C2|nr:AraC family transcriptional regulator [Flavobacterium sp. MK4S-17]
MNVFLKYNFDVTCKTILKDQLDKLNISYKINGMGNIYFPERIHTEQYELLALALQHYGIDIIDNKKNILAQQVKEAIIAMLHIDNNLPLIKVSSYLSEKLDANYRTISQAFTDVCHISIENFIILKRIELAKQLLASEKFTLTEISYKLNYSSVAHLSHQFKKLTGLTPTTFQKIIKNKRAILN